MCLTLVSTTFLQRLTMEVELLIIKTLGSSLPSLADTSILRSYKLKDTFSPKVTFISLRKT
jgi:hypothetical protein